MPPPRPSPKELHGKIRAAKEYVAAKKWIPVELTKVAADFQALDLYTEEEQSSAMLEALDEITPDDYSGARPPQRSYEPTIKGGELTAFTWNSSCFGKRMYFKFCIRDETCWIVSIHEDDAEPTKGDRDA